MYRVNKGTDGAVWRHRLVGVSFANDDGVSRQDLIANVRAGDPVRLWHNTASKFGSAEIRVLNDRGACLGMVEAKFGPQVLEIMNRNLELHAYVNRVDGGEPEKPTLGIEIEIHDNQNKSPAKPQERRVEVDCPHCGNTLLISPQYIGRTGKCWICQGEFIARLPKHISDVANIEIPEWRPTPPVVIPADVAAVDRAPRSGAIRMLQIGVVLVVLGYTWPLLLFGIILLLSIFW